MLQEWGDKEPNNKASWWQVVVIVLIVVAYYGIPIAMRLIK